MPIGRTLGAGDNLVMGDNGVIRVAGTSTTLTTQSPTLGGNDTITALGGNDMMALGNGADVADLGEGNNIGLGDDSGVIAVRVRTPLCCQPRRGLPPPALSWAAMTA